jgi:hypothetical protein
VQLKDLELLLPDAVQSPPSPGTSVTVSTNFLALGRVSTDGGVSFSPFRGTAEAALRLTAGSPGEPFDTEMLMLNLELPAGPSGQPTLLRESPTQASKGPTSIRQMPAGNWQMDSFFDIFTEISDDGGTTWIPETSAHRATLYSCPPEGTFSSPNLPAATGLHRALEPLQFQTATGLVRFRHLVIFEPTDPEPPPPTGGSAMVGTAIKVQGEWAVGGGVFAPFSTTATAHIQITHHTEDGAVFFDTEMLALDISGGGLPAGTLIRESPTLPSRGKTSLRSFGGKSHISSFFDVFTELSLDGGQSWQAARHGACRVVQDGDRHGHFFPTGCFPQGGDYASGQDDSVAFPGSAVVLRNLRHRPATQPQPPPDPGMATTQALDGMLEYELSLDGGSTFTRHREYGGFECFPIRWHEAPVPGDTEMSLECCALTVGSLRLRESPTLPSRGQHRIRPTSDGYLVDSFFDIFTEISLDSGVSWLPAGAPLRCDLAPYVEQDLAFRSDFMPPRDGSLETRKFAEPVPIRAPGTPMNSIRNMKLRDFSSSYPPNPCDEQTASVTAHASFEWSTDDGQTWTEHTADCELTMVSRRAPVAGSTGLFDTEMLAMSLSGGSLPPGMRLRESPSRPSKGRTSIASRLMEEEGIYHYAIDSFFDIFTELSLDGGSTWEPAIAALHLELHSGAPPVMSRSDWLPLVASYRESDFGFAVPFGPLAAIRFWQTDCASPLCSFVDGRAPAPAPGSNLVKTMTAPVSCDITLDGGTGHHRATGMADITVLHSDMTTDGGGWTLTGEILQLDVELGGAGLPSGLRLRESPTRASTGRTSMRLSDGHFQVDSFFDIFTELSLDGGASWTTACKPLRIHAGPSAGPGTRETQPGLPANGRFRGAGEHPPSRTPNSDVAKDAVIDGAQPRTAGEIGTPPPPTTLPPPGGRVRTTIGGILRFDYAADGMTFTRCEAPCELRLELSNTVAVSPTESRCDLEVICFEALGGNLPEGMLLRDRHAGRESPTLPSRGRVSVREIPGAGYQVSSFFDIFTELSLDGGDTWREFDLPIHFELEQPGVLANHTNPWPPSGNLRLPPGDPDFDLLFAEGGSLSFFDVFVEMSAPIPPPAVPGGTIISSALGNVSLRVSPPSAPPVDVSAPVNVQVSITRKQADAADGTGYFDTEMLALDLTGSPTLPDLRLRESPTRPSTGRMTLKPLLGGPSLVDSFFDVFFDVSFDGGGTWQAAEGAIRFAQASPRVVVRDAAGDGELFNHTFAHTLAGSNRTAWLRLDNDGDADLVITGYQVDGMDAASFNVAIPQSMVPAGGHISFLIGFVPATAGPKFGQLVIESSDPLRSPLAFGLQGRAFVADQDDDGDGVTNQQELNHAACGFDPAVDDSALVSQLRIDGFYRASDMQSLALGRPVLARDPATGSFHLSLGVLKSNTLAGWTPLLGFTPTHDPATGLLDLEIEPDGSGAEFYQVFGNSP